MLVVLQLSLLSPGGRFSAVKDSAALRWSRALAKMQRGVRAELGAGGDAGRSHCSRAGWGQSRAVAAAQGHRLWHYLMTRQLQ